MSVIVADWRRRKSQAFDLFSNSTARRTATLDLWGVPREIYANANLSIYSAAPCNGACPFCVERLRPASRGMALPMRPAIEDDGAYLACLDETLTVLSPLRPSVSITGGEPSLDPRLPDIVDLLKKREARQRTMTTNGTGLLETHRGRPLFESVAGSLHHLSLSIPSPDLNAAARLMRLPIALSEASLHAIVKGCESHGTKVRLSCVLLEQGVRDLDGVRGYLGFARQLGARRAIFRQLMLEDPATASDDPVVEFGKTSRVRLEPLLAELDTDPSFALVRQIVGYYYYVEVYRHGDMLVAFEEADLGQLERSKQLTPGVVHELVFHNSGRLCSTWQEWDGGLGQGPNEARPD